MVGDAHVGSVWRDGIGEPTVAPVRSSIADPSMDAAREPSASYALRSMASAHAPEKLWRYTSLVKAIAWALIVVGVVMLPLSLLAQLGDGLTVKYTGTLLGISGITGVLFYPLLHMWFKKSRPSAYLERAKKLSGPRRMPAAHRDVVKWGVTVGVFLFIGTVFMVGFLVPVLKDSGPSGIAEGVVVGLMGAWGVFNLDDVRKIEEAERTQGRTYFAVGHRPTGAGNHLFWTPTNDQPAEPAA